MVNIEWNGKMGFEATPPSNIKFMMDAYPEVGGEGLGPTPLEALLSSLGACSAMDVISILRKKKQEVTAYRIEVTGERGPEGEYPRPYVSLSVKHIVEGENLDEAAVARAVELSDTKYCSVIATLRAAPSVSSSYEIKSLAK
ncbi:MAG: OsmC family protein [Chthonomonas sp.]|nr:OsmC family protein [Chthonomonas sp.]